ncbi:hypothetical protein LTR05_007323 [Lithohypha guttulata]|uniref:Uncharacterized protein n=1 Tax=Lithohypha guttulata TaxID=1690604 RepID=A0AAN7Y919_9EURO|nr:hypothetical protein LTR05_007323 [Lithohypha guttulata]
MGSSQSKPTRPQKGGLARSNARHGRPAPNKKQQQQQQRYAPPPPPPPNKNKSLPPLPKQQQQQPRLKPSKSQSNMSALGFGDIVADRQYYMTKPLPPLPNQRPKVPTKAPRKAPTPTPVRTPTPTPEQSFFTGSKSHKSRNPDPSTNNIFLCAPNSGIPSQIPDFALKKQGVSTCRACRKAVNADTDYVRSSGW